MERYLVVIERDGIVAIPAELLAHIDVRDGDDVKLEPVDGTIVVTRDDGVVSASTV